jgi:hypothetical protein
MHQCADISARLDDWLDGALDPVSQREVDAHLMACDSCRSAFAAHGRMAAQLRSLGHLADSVADAPRGVRGARFATRLIRIAAAIAIVAGGAWLARQLLTAPGETQIAQKGGGSEDPGFDGSDERPFEPVIQLVKDDGRISVPVESNNPRIHIVWLYESTPIPEVASNDESASRPASSL